MKSPKKKRSFGGCLWEIKRSPIPTEIDMNCFYLNLPVRSRHPLIFSSAFQVVRPGNEPPVMSQRPEAAGSNGLQTEPKKDTARQVSQRHSQTNIDTALLLPPVPQRRVSSRCDFLFLLPRSKFSERGCPRCFFSTLLFSTRNSADESDKAELRDGVKRVWRTR